MTEGPKSPSASDGGPVHTLSLAAADATTGSEVAPTFADRPLPSSQRYQLGEEIARGGMGVVYRATDHVLGREVAVKVLKEKLTSTSTVSSRFLDEARITAQLQHPAIPPVHDLGTLADGRPFLAMKLIKGQTLADEIAAESDSSRGHSRFIAVFEHLCQALAYAHDRNVIHRDLKPSNVMVGSFGEVQVMDWGLSKILSKRSAGTTDDPNETQAGTEIRSSRDLAESETQAGSVLGTPAYMPPEQAIGAVAKVDKRSDVFGLGAILAVILTGKPPYTSDSAETTRLKAAQGKVDECFNRLDASNADPELKALAKKCLNPDPADRPADAGEVAKAVAELRAAADDRARKAELDRVRAEGEKTAILLKASEQRKRRRVQLLLIALLGVLTFGLGAFAWWDDRQATERKTERERAEVQRAQEKAAIEGERYTRQIRLSSSAATALTEVKSRAEEAWKHAEEPERMNVAVDLAHGVLRRSEGFADESELTEEVRKDLAAVRQTIADLDRHARLFLTAERALLDHAQSGFGTASSQRTAQRLAEAFHEYGWSSDKFTPEVVASTIVKSRVRNQLLGYLGEWSFQDPKEQWARSVLQIARHQSGGSLATWQSLREGKEREKLVAFSARPEALLIGPEQIGQLGHDLEGARTVEARLALLRRAVERYPNHVWLRYNLTETCTNHSPPLKAEALQHAAASAALRPESTVFQTILGDALTLNDAFELAQAAYQRALTLDGNNAAAHGNMGIMLSEKNDIVGAEAQYRKAIKLAPFDPRTAIAHYNLGRLFFNQKQDMVGAEKEFRDALKLDPKLANAHLQLAALLSMKGDRPGAEEELLLTIKFDPNLVMAHLGLGSMLRGKGDMAGAEKAFRSALQVEPANAMARVSLASLLERKGELDGAIDLYKRILKDDPKNPEASTKLSKVEKRKALYQRLPDVLAGKTAPATPAEAFEFAELCGERYVQQYAAAVRLYEQAFSADPKLVLVATGRCYNPACYAARAARGDGKDAPTDPGARSALRAKALAWLKTDLEFYQNQIKSKNLTERGAAAVMLSGSLVDADLSGLRPGPLRTGMPEEEQKKWDAFWKEVRATLAEAQQP